jgi:hypothetical protein
MFTMTGLKNGQRYSVTMKSGKLSGDKLMVDLIKTQAKLPHGYLGVPPSECDRDYLESEPPASHLAELCFDSVESFSTDWYDDEKEYPGLVVY